MSRRQLVNIAVDVLHKHGIPEADAEISAEDIVAFVCNDADVARQCFGDAPIEQLVETAAEWEWGVEYTGHRRYPTCSDK